MSEYRLQQLGLLHRPDFLALLRHHGAALVGTAVRAALSTVHYSVATPKRPDLVLLDLMLPGRDGIQLMEDTPAMRDLPVIFLSGYGEEETVARALEKGAVDYVGKPFSPTELVARIQAALRGRSGRDRLFALGELAIDYGERRVTLAGQPLELTATEYDLLRELAVNAGRVLTYEVLLRRVWRLSGPGDSRRVRAFMKKLRSKLGDDAARPTYIFTVHRVGYRMAKPDKPDQV